MSQIAAFNTYFATDPLVKVTALLLSIPIEEQGLVHCMCRHGTNNVDTKQNLRIFCKDQNILQRVIMLKIGNQPTCWTKFTPRLSLCQIPNEDYGVEYLHVKLLLCVSMAVLNTSDLIRNLAKQ